VTIGDSEEIRQPAVMWIEDLSSIVWSFRETGGAINVCDDPPVPDGGRLD
jgi:hypothetical protein